MVYNPTWPPHTKLSLILEILKFHNFSLLYLRGFCGDVTSHENQVIHDGLRLKNIYKLQLIVTFHVCLLGCDGLPATLR